MGCGSAKRKLNSNEDSCCVCDNIEGHDNNIYTLKLLKCYHEYPAMNDFTSNSYYNQSITQNGQYRNQNFNEICKCGYKETEYLRLDSIKPTKNSECTIIDDEVEEREQGTMMPTQTKRCYSKRSKPECSSAGSSLSSSTVSYEHLYRSSDSYLSFRCQCICSKKHRYHQNNENVIENSNKKDIGIQKESEELCTMREQYDDYIKKMEKSWYCCYNLLHEIKELLSGIDENGSRKLTNDSPIDNEKTDALLCSISICSEVLENAFNEAEYEVNCRPANI